MKKQSLQCIKSPQAEPAKSNNYIYLFIYPFIPDCYKPVKVIPSIDKIRISTTSKAFCESGIIQKLYHLFNNTKTIHTDNSEIIQFFNDDRLVLSLPKSPTNSFYHTLTLHQPTKEIQYKLNRLFSQMQIPISFTYLELAIDFQFPDGVVGRRKQLKQFLDSHIYVKNSRSTPIQVKTTSYTGARTSCKNVTVYFPKYSRDTVRLELRLRNRILKRDGIVFPFEAGKFDLSKYIGFREFDADKFADFIFKQRNMQARLKKSSNKEFSSALCKRLIWSVVNGVYMEDKTLMETMKAINDDKYVGSCFLTEDNNSIAFTNLLPEAVNLL